MSSPSPALTAMTPQLLASRRSSSPHLRPAWLRRPQALLPRLLPLARRPPPTFASHSKPGFVALTTKPPPLPASFLFGGANLHAGKRLRSATPLPVLHAAASSSSSILAPSPEGSGAWARAATACDKRSLIWTILLRKSMGKRTLHIVGSSSSDYLHQCEEAAFGDFFYDSDDREDEVLESHQVVILLARPARLASSNAAADSVVQRGCFISSASRF
ncbi:hypothetical protein PVAP13_7KG290800 [Panicum virgatum]|uniref:Uncharacterized protein n=1 Tax=Panicum virgatum TaxID=38727 RepID=A0A8T0QLY2_PANVG|nr:hypothetical protein PVAP13_7KG290800 [Panicum virgatum]